MTAENYAYRTDPLFLRNQFLGEGKLKLPDIPKCILTQEELDGLRLIGYDRAKNGNDSHFNRMVHFFLYDYKFEDIWTAPEKRVEVLKKYRAVLSPDFSMYLEMHPAMQLYNTFRNRWVGAYLANQKIKVVPTVNWDDESSFDFCFEGIAKGSTVAVSTYIAHAHSTCNEQKEWFLKGYNEMLRRVEPEVIICYHTPFPEMQGNIVYVDYELSSWKHDKDDICKAHMRQEGIRITKHSGFVILDSIAFDKGGGSAGEGGGLSGFPGWERKKAPGPDYEWRGQEPIGGGKGNWYNPETGESMHPDLEHGEPIGPHWDYRNFDGDWFRIFPDDTFSPKSYEGEGFMTDTSDWRLQGQERYLMNAQLRKEVYAPSTNTSDHDHCAFCWEKFSESSDHLRTGYYTPKGGHWICEQCYQDFKETFSFEVSD